MHPVNIREYEALAREKLPKETFDFIAGGAEDELTVAENEAAFRRIQLRPRVLVDVSHVDVSTRVLGEGVSFPVLLAPVAFQGAAHPDGDVASARAAAEAGTIMVLSTASSSTIEEVAESSTGPKWFQLYIHEHGLAQRLVERAEASGFTAICMTADTPRLGRRERDMRNGPALDQQLPPPKNLVGEAAPGGDLSGFPHHSRTWEDIDWLRSLTSLPLVIKGIMTDADARLAIEHGAKAIIVSNHGGRQLDGVPATIDVLAEVVEATAGRAEVLLDGGVRRGTDVLKALALGARAVLIGRPFVWGLAVDGEQGVGRVLRMLRDELETSMALAGCPSVSNISNAIIRS
jgi:isopentenyl diphosphate isomerase/L-lactate dehydrogenase-like FMN-dependent dehydrogenase